MSNDKFYGIEKLSLVDYEGKLACTLFTGGCNFRCPFCHNASLVIDLKNVDSITDEEILSYLEKRKKTIDAVVITGGEPTLMPSIAQKVKLFKDMGYLVKLDTNGSNYEVLKELVNKNLIDYVAMDVKNSIDCYKNTAGINNDDILNNVIKSIKFLKDNNIDYEFRTTLVEELHSSESIEEMGKMLKGSKRLFLQKFNDKGTCIKNNLHEVEIKKALEYKCILEKYIQIVQMRGY